MPIRPATHFHLDLRYLLLCEDTDPSPAAGESQQVRWFGAGRGVGHSRRGASGRFATVAGCGGDRNEPEGPNIPGPRARTCGICGGCR